MQNSAHMLGQGSWAKAAGPKQQAKQKPGPTTPGHKKKQHVHPRTPAPFINALYDHMRMTQAKACDLGIFALHILALRSHAHSRRTTPGRPALPIMGPDRAPPPAMPPRTSPPIRNTTHGSEILRGRPRTSWLFPRWLRNAEPGRAGVGLLGPCALVAMPRWPLKAEARLAETNGHGSGHARA